MTESMVTLATAEHGEFTCSTSDLASAITKYGNHVMTNLRSVAEYRLQVNLTGVDSAAMLIMIASRWEAPAPGAPSPGT